MQIVEVSVIIPNYNHARFLKKRIDSVLEQTYRNFEIIILDDHSDDDSRAVIETYRSNEKVAHIIYNEVNSGSTFKQWKKGLELATGKYIWIAESDDYAAVEFLEELVKPFKENTNVVISFCRSAHVDDNGDFMGLTLHADELDNTKWTKNYVEKGHVEITRYLKYRNTIPNASAVLFKKPVDIDAMLSVEMKFCGDWLFWQRMLQQPGALIAYSSEVMNFFRTHASSTRHLTDDINVEKELRRFKEYKSFVPANFINPFDERFRWMMAEWIDRGVNKALKKTRFRFFPLLHPALIARYYLYSIKNMFSKNK